MYNYDKADKPASGTLEPTLFGNLSYLYNRHREIEVCKKTDIRNNLLFHFGDLAELVECVYTVAPTGIDNYIHSHIGAFFEMCVKKYGVDFVVTSIHDYSDIRYVMTDIRSEMLWLMAVGLEAIRQNQVEQNIVEIIGYYCCITKMLGFDVKKVIAEYRKICEIKESRDYKQQPDPSIGLRALLRRVFSGLKK